MKFVCILIGSFLFLNALQAQDSGANLSSALTTGILRMPRTIPPVRAFDSLAPPGQKLTSDTMAHNKYGDLKNDNPDYNGPSPIWLCATRVLLNNAVTIGFDRYVLDADYARIGPNTWSHYIKTGWEWDNDRFGMNYFAHPYSGAAYFNAGRSNGYGFYESVPFAFGGSLLYEYFGENTLPSYNDLINTTITGTFLGEISYRLSSDFLDDRATGSERFFREFFAGLINPQRAFSRLLRGRLTRSTYEEVYQKEPLSMMFTAGGHFVNDGRSFGTGPFHEMLTLQLAYGDPFEHTSRKIFDYFTLRADLTAGLGRKIIDNVLGSALLFGNNVRAGSMEMLFGGFQHYDFWDNNTFELGTIGFGGGMVSKLPLSNSSNLFFDFHLAVVPLGANSTHFGPETTQVRDYNYGGGAEGQFEATLGLGGWVSGVLRTNFYWIHTYIGIAGDNYIGIVRPTIIFRIVDNLSLGFEHLIYYSDRYSGTNPVATTVRTEQKIFVQFYVDKFASAL